MSEDTWRKQLILSPSGAPKPLLANSITALRDCPAWEGALSFDAFGMQTMLDRAPPWQIDTGWDPRAWTPQDDLLAADWMQRQGIGINVATMSQAVEAVAHDREFHPVIDYLEGLQHDGVIRSKGWLTKYLGADQSAYHDQVGRAVLVAAVARIYDPGCKVDTVPILEGPQGARKSTAIKALFHPWFTDEIADLASKDSAMQTRGVWGIEISELDAMSRAEVSRIKAFISRTTDRFRPPYGNRVIESQRSCVFWGSTNSDDYLKDATGGRRFWPIKVGKIDVDALLRDRDQLWAEAKKLFDAGVHWWLTGAEVAREAEEQQRDRYAGDPWDAAIERYVRGEMDVTVEKVLREGLHLDLSRCSQIEMNRVSRSLRTLGYVRHQRRSGDKRLWVYRKLVTSGDRTTSGSNVTTLELVTNAEVVTREVVEKQA
ncbi:virulence-associated E family protein [Bradyrhizobium sp.]|uniref:virulence-associated E family protein n=1 Tax=Bradyrhizobium sp. TaxID=376 RepID=UPI002DDD94E2|nr:virulence-associated E family protein [Bradyrhizobium sp.]HEV2156351.1 virulence-associated E family protein [Bradyrhizobium sp.]